MAAVSQLGKGAFKEMQQMKDSGIAWVGKIPQNWQCSKIGALFTENKHKNIFGKETKALQFNYGTIIPKKDFDVEDEYVARTILNYNIVDDGMIMLNGLNLNFDFVTKRVALVRERGVITSAYMSFYPADKMQLTSEYAHYLLKSYDHCAAFHNMGGGVRKILNFSELKRQPFILPPLDEQNRIVRFLDKECEKVDELKADIQAQIDMLEQYKRSVINESVTHGLSYNATMKDSGIDWVGEIPIDWRVVPLYCLYTERKNINVLGKESNLLSLSYGQIIRKDINTREGLL
ncbi:MAG: restriction endonuclease subunit S, partial [Bacilli bacterium]|nr:restriction endonuclease subunit S [Bacilli bacterium]